MWPAPLFLDEPAALLAAEFGLTEDAAAADVTEGCVVDPVAAAVEAAPDGPVEPLISAWIVELKVPVMPVRLFKPLEEIEYEEDMTYVNLAENASAGALIEVMLGSFRLTDVILMKLAKGFGHLLEKKIIQHSLGVEVRSNRGIRCKIYLSILGNINGAN